MANEARLHAAETAKAPKEPRINRDWDDEVDRKIGVQTRNKENNVKELFLEVAIDQTVKIVNTAEEAAAFFTAQGPRFTCRILKRFIEACALFVKGNIHSVPSLRILEGTLWSLFGAAKGAGNPVDRTVKHDSLMWVQSSLPSRGLAHTDEKGKAGTLPEDVSDFLRCFFDNAFCSSQLTTRDALTFALLVNLIIDCNVFISELTRPSISNEAWATWKAENPEKIFTWKYVELYAFPSIAGKVQLQAQITFKGLKNTGQKGIPLRLLPLDLAAEDSLRWLLILGLIDKVFDKITSWADFEALDPSPHGTKICIKTDKMETPVLRNAVRKPAIETPALIEDELMRYQQVAKQFENISRHCGLEYNMLSGVLQRGSAYTLAMKVSHEERCARMGHSDRDTAYWGAYRNTASTVDFQSLRRELEEESVERMSSAFLNRTAQPPKRVSDKGIQEVHQDLELIELLEEQCALSDQIIEKYGSFDAAGNSTLLGEYRKLKDSYVEREGRLLAERFKVEWKEFFQTGGISPQAIPETPLEMSEADILDEMIDAADKEEALLANIDPALLAEEENEARKSAEALLADLEAFDTAPIDGSDEVGIEALEKQQTATASTTNLSVVAKSKNIFSARAIARYSLLSDLADLLYNQTPDLTEAQFADICVTKFNHLHPADRYNPNQEPLPGTMDCRFCGVSLVEIIHENEHITMCQGRSMARAIMDEFENKETEIAPSKTCSMASGTTGKKCTYTYKSVNSPASHRGHVNHAHRDEQSRDYVCHDHSITSDDFPDFRIHLVTLHSAPSSIISLKSASGVINPEVLVFWCKFCQVWIPRTESSTQDHFSTHIKDVDSAIASHGFAGVYQNTRWQHPSFCIFCLFDNQASFSTQFHEFADQRGFLRHVEGHVKAMEAEECRVCPAASATANGVPAQCGETEALEKEGLAKHLVDVHGLLIDVGKFVKKQDGTDQQANKKRKMSALGGDDTNRI